MKRLALILSALVVSFSVTAKEVYTLQPGDILEVSVWQEADLQREVLVRPDGGISFPLVGNIDAGNRSIEDLNTEIVKKLSTYISDPVVTVSLKQMLGNRIYVLGKVNKPGEYVVNRYVDVLQVLSMAGGMNPFALGNEIQVLRRENGIQKSIPFHYDDVEEGDLEQNIILNAGDIILVP